VPLSQPSAQNGQGNISNDDVLHMCRINNREGFVFAPSMLKLKLFTSGDETVEAGVRSYGIPWNEYGSE